jgi:predicted MFS family arabinose efflux permease
LKTLAIATTFIKNRKVDRDILLLNIAHLLLRTLIQGLLPVYPVFIKSLEAGDAQAGYVLSLSYMMILLGTWLSGRLTPRLVHPRTLLLLTVVPLSLLLFSFSAIQHWHTLLPVSMSLFFFCGLSFTSFNIFTGFLSHEENVGKNYALLSSSSQLGTIIGSFVIGFLIHLLGYKTGFMVIGLTILTCSVFLLLIEKKPITVQATIEKQSLLLPGWLARLAIAAFLGSFVLFASKFIFSLELKKMGYPVEEISYISGYGNLLALFAPLMIGKLLNRKTAFLIYSVTLLSILMSVVLMSVQPSTMMIFLFITGGISVFAYSSTAPSSFLIYNAATPSTLSRSLSFMNAVTWVSAIIGFLFTGIILERFGFVTMCICLITMCLVALVFVNRASVIYPKSQAG